MYYLSLYNAKALQRVVKSFVFMNIRVKAEEYDICIYVGNIIYTIAYKSMYVTSIL